MQQLQQRDWCEQQIEEKKSRKQTEQQINNLFDQQSLFHDNLLVENQSEHNRRRLENEKDT